VVWTEKKVGKGRSKEKLFPLLACQGFLKKSRTKNLIFAESVLTSEGTGALLLSGLTGVHWRTCAKARLRIGAVTLGQLRTSTVAHQLSGLQAQAHRRVGQ
jgi:hypothetical protein